MKVLFSLLSKIGGPLVTLIEAIVAFFQKPPQDPPSVSGPSPTDLPGIND